MNQIKKNIHNFNIKNIDLIVVTKTQPLNILKQLLTIKEVKNIGENKWQDFQERFIKTNLIQQFKTKNVKFHFIGHLQSNKVKNIVEYFDVIQSVDSEKLLRKIHSEAMKINKIQNILLEINVSNDSKKFGLTNNIQPLIKLGEALTNIKIIGLMTVLQNNLSTIKQEEYFTLLSKLGAKHFIYPPILSMGMSNDYKTAIKSGSNMIRIGSGIFNAI